MENFIFCAVLDSNKSLLWATKIKSTFLKKGLRTVCRRTAKFETDANVLHTTAKIYTK